MVCSSEALTVWRGNQKSKWYVGIMSGTFQITVGDRGRVVLPAEVRERAGLAEGSVLVLLESPDGLALLTREQLKARVRAELTGRSLVEELLEARRTLATQEDAAVASRLS